MGDYIPEGPNLIWETKPLVDELPSILDLGSVVKPPKHSKESSCQGETPHQDKTSPNNSSAIK